MELWEDSVEQGEDIRWWAKLPVCSSDFSAQTLCSVLIDNFRRSEEEQNSPTFFYF